MLTWSERPPIGASGIYGGEPRRMFNVIVDQHYRVLRKVSAQGAGVFTDLHDFKLTSRNTAIVLGYRFVRRDLRPYGGPRDGQVIDAVIQEVNLATGKLLLDWHAAHVPLSDTVVPAPKSGPWDFFHMNSVAEDSDGQLLVSARHASAVYKIDRRKGDVLWRLGGKRSSFTMGAGARFAYQHDAQLTPNGVSIFDNGSTEFDSAHGRKTRVVFLRLDRAHRTATLDHAITHPSGVRSSSQGNARLQPNRDTFVGWGNSPKISEFGPQGQLLWDARLPNGYFQSYRAFRAPWVGIPDRPPAVRAGSARGELSVYASWNGSTQVTGWRVLAGPSASALQPLRDAPWGGLETLIQAPSAASFARVQALGADGAVLRSSAVTKVIKR